MHNEETGNLACSRGSMKLIMSNREQTMRQRLIGTKVKVAGNTKHDRGTSKSQQKKHSKMVERIKWNGNTEAIYQVK